MEICVHDKDIFAPSKRMEFGNDYKVEGQLSIFDFIEKPAEPEAYKIRRNCRLIELFAGLGSQALALETMGIPFEHWFVCEIDKYSVATYNAIHQTNFEVSDITKVTANDLNIIDTNENDYIVFYSFPCQDLSVAGRGKGMSKTENAEERTRSGLLWEVERLINECEKLAWSSTKYGMPSVLIMENVPNVHGKANIEDFTKWKNFLKSKGYESFTSDLNAKDFGIPQSRDRTFMVSIYGGGYFKFPEPIELLHPMWDYLEDEVDEKFFLKNERSENLLDQLQYDGKLEEMFEGIEDGRKPIAWIIDKGDGNLITSKDYFSEKR